MHPLRRARQVRSVVHAVKPPNPWEVFRTLLDMPETARNAHLALGLLQDKRVSLVDKGIFLGTVGGWTLFTAAVAAPSIAVPVGGELGIVAAGTLSATKANEALGEFIDHADREAVAWHRQAIADHRGPFDGPGEKYRAVHFHVPLLNRKGEVVDADLEGGEAIS